MSKHLDDDLVSSKLKANFACCGKKKFLRELYPYLHYDHNGDWFLLDRRCVQCLS